MTDTRNTSDSTTAGTNATDKTAHPKGGEKPSISDSLFDGELQASYNKMMGSGKTESTISGGVNAVANRDLQQRGVITHLTVAEQKPAAAHAESAAVEAAPRADAGDIASKQRLSYMQETVKNFLPLVLAPDKGTLTAQQTKELGDRQSAIAAEEKRGEFGPATKAAYGQYVDWLEKKALPSTVRDLQYMRLPADNPSGPKAPTADLQINRNVIPDDSQLQRLDDAVKWAQGADSRVKEAQTKLLANLDGKFVETVEKLHLPVGWIEDMDRDHARWRTSVGSLIDGTLTTRSNFEILDELRRGGAIAELPGAKQGVAVTHDNNGKLTGIHLDLPTGWDLTVPANKTKADNLQAVLAETTALLKDTAPQLRNVTDHAERVLSWGDTPVKDTKGVFNAKGDFLGLVPKDAKVATGQHTEDVNLVQSRYSVEEKNNKIIVHQEVQAQSVPWWGYQNLIGVSDVGNKIDITQTYNPNDSVVVRTETGYDIKLAKDLGSYKNWQMTKHYGEKALMGALDVGMVVSGTIEIGAAFKAARIAGVGITGLEVLGRSGAKTFMTSEGLEVSSRMLAGQAAKGLTRTTIGAAGLFNNAGANESSLGRGVNTARSVYFLADAGIGLGQTGWRASKSLFGSSDIVAARNPIAGLVAGSRTQNFYNITHGMFKVSEYGFIPLATTDLASSIGRIQNDRSAHVVKAAELLKHDQPRDPAQ